jgi:hypothetical protein
MPRRILPRSRPRRIWKSILEKGSDDSLKRLVRMTIPQFTLILDSLRGEYFPRNIGVLLTFEDKILMVFLWLVKYPDLSELAILFGTSKTVVGRIVDNWLDVLCRFFSKFVPNEFFGSESSSLSSRIIGIVDSTIHAIRKPAKYQHLSYSGHYKTHGMLTHLLIDWEGYIIAYLTNVPGSLHDSFVASKNELFRSVLDGEFALGDPGFAGVDYVVAGLKSNQVHFSCFSFFCFDEIYLMMADPN